MQINMAFTLREYVYIPGQLNLNVSYHSMCNSRHCWLVC